MDNPHHALPPLDPLVAFEAAARLGSFTRAARELGISQAAVSQRIRQLEDHMGTPLFLRANRKVQLTRAGRSLQKSAGQALQNISATSGEIRARHGVDRLTLSADPAIAALWLMPRLSRFRDETDGEVSVRLVTSDTPAEGLGDEVDLAILHGSGDWPGMTADLLFSEEVFPVCAPDYLMHNPPVIGPKHLPDHPLLELDDPRGGRMTWRGWLNAVDVHAPVTRAPLRANSLPLIIDEAKKGLGIALGWQHLVDADLAAGHLVRPVSDRVRTGQGFYLVSDATHRLDGLSETFRTWLIREAPGR